MKSSTKTIQGWLVLAALAALTAVEFWLSSATRPALPYLIIIAIVKAVLIVHYFMRISQLWVREDQHS
ncbi:MAG: cytochrome C oxidase subunit IV family protein [Chloroflexi bacterium]|nr:cytochrome C oxidase subunit IV family protein [Chloroflexota bacterium]MBI3339176.1 cytochrome C oxidase subunit IV family protein [Chloroflexota bacterium]